MGAVKAMGTIWVVAATGIAGSVMKILGGVLYGSNTLFVDALTSVANMASLISILWFRRLAYTPPDSDHHFGHERFEYIGVLPMLITYGFVAGLSVARLYYVREYRVELNAFYLALAAMLMYGVAVASSRRASPSLRAYGAFTVSELLEGLVGVVASLGGALYSYLVDYGGAVLLTSYIFYEIYEEGRRLSSFMADEAPPLEVYERVVETAESMGYNVESLRLRTIVPGRYHGDMVLQPKSTAPSDLRELRRVLQGRGVDVCIETEKLNS